MKIYANKAYSFHQLGEREGQEDARYPDSNEISEQAPCYVVCDGVGGNDAGEVASQTVCEAFGRYFEHFNGLEQELGIDDFTTVLDEAYNDLDELSRGDQSLKQMATTLTFLCLHKGGAMVAHIGDSRIYHIRPKAGIIYRSSDHSLINAMVHSGDITPDEAENHPKSNYITRCMNPYQDGQARSCASLLQITDVQAGDYFLLCTDGVLHCCDDNALLEILSSEMPDEMKMQYLARRCYFSSDNNTAILIGIKDVLPDDSEIDSQDEAEWTKTKSIDPKDRCPEIIEVESIGPMRGSFLHRLWNSIFN